MRHSYTRNRLARPKKSWGYTDFSSHSWRSQVPMIGKVTQVSGIPEHPYEWSLQVLGTDVMVYIMCPVHEDVVAVRRPTHTIKIEENGSLTISPSVVCPRPCTWHVFIDYSEVRSCGWKDEWKKQHGSLPYGVSDTSPTGSRSDG